MRNNIKTFLQNESLKISFEVAMSRSSDPLRISPNDPLRELFEACKSGDVLRVRSMVDSTNVNARDTAGRRSTPLHFAAGIFTIYYIFHVYILKHTPWYVLKVKIRFIRRKLINKKPNWSLSVCQRGMGIY